ncbi:MAG TPA: hypothetical protein PKA05_05690 [Roseiflexaceae bacterium]|nr:hypothetical protein [Roseiflexaceae bacterium]HMP39854.1 hypothetical protein [Roseiflexaceae bacterium]
MTLDEAITELTERIQRASPDAVVRVQRRSADEAAIRAYAPAAHEDAIKDATRDLTLALLTEDDIDVQVLVYDIATSLPPQQ